MDPVPERALTLDPRPLGEGGQGRVFRVTAIGGRPPRRPTAFKQYRAQWRTEVDAEALRALVRFRRRARGPLRRLLYERTAWPEEVVQSHPDRPAGFLMGLIPDEHLRPLSLPGAAVTYCQLQHLLNDDAYLELIGVTPPDGWRTGFLHDVAETVDALHRRGVTVGDLSPLNVLPGFGRGPRCFLVDCDAMLLDGRSVLPQVQTRGWETPAGERAASAGDAYKLALLAVRLFAGDQETRDTHPLSRASAPLGDLARRGLRDDPGCRPTPARWVEAARDGAPRRGSRLAWRLTRLLAAPAPPPRLAAATAAAVAVLGLFTAGWAIGGSTDLPAFLRDNGQARAVDRLLDRSGTDNARIAEAIRMVDRCRDLPAAVADIARTRDGRARAVTEVERMRTDALPDGAALKKALGDAMRAALAADEEYLLWARSAARNGCGTGRAHRAAATRLAGLAGRAKRVAIRRWKPVADRYGHDARDAGSI